MTRLKIGQSLMLASLALALPTMSGASIAPAFAQTKPAAKPAKQAAPGASAPATGAASPSSAGSGPVSVDADNGIEWRRDEKMYIAVGNAKAVRGDVTVLAQKLVAYYREREGGGTDIYKMEAFDDVVIKTANETAHGEKGVYDIDQQVLVLTGKNLSLQTRTQTVTARDTLEYWDDRKIAVARGNAVAVEGDKRISGDILSAHIVEDPKTNASRINRVDAFGSVRVSSPGEYATGSKGVYSFDSNIATLVGDVKVTQGQNQLNGDYGEVNLNNGISRMLSGPAAGRAGTRVRGLLVPEQGKKPEDAPAAGASVTPAPTTPAPSPASRPAPARPRS